MDKHTPGPWETSIQRWPNGSLNGTPSIYAPSAGVHPAVLSNLPEIDANARLIAAAPDMLDALKEIVRNCESYRTLDNMAGRLCHIAEYAIRKAEGE